VYRLKAARPDLTIVINGGITTLDECQAHLQHVDGVMMGRAAYQTPFVLADVDRRVFGVTRDQVTRASVLGAMLPYVEAHIARGGRLNNITRHILGLYHGEPRARVFRRHLSEKAVGASARGDVLREAIELVEQRAAQQSSAA
jgi:tRNA-dihydrouridine synthase A